MVSTAGIAVSVLPEHRFPNPGLCGNGARNIHYSWKRKYGDMNVSEVKRLKQLEAENARLKELVAELSLDNKILKDVISKNS